MVIIIRLFCMDFEAQQQFFIDTVYQLSVCNMPLHEKYILICFHPYFVDAIVQPTVHRTSLRCVMISAKGARKKGLY